MKQKSKFEIDFEEALPFFPKLNFKEDKKKGLWIISGKIDICDQDGNYWETFDIIIYIPYSYPNCVPLVREKSNIIQRDDDWHIDNLGFCCLNMDHKLQIMSKRGINLTNFIRNIVYPYFANQLYKKANGEYADGTYLHGFDGVRQYYSELNICDDGLAIKILDGIINNKIPGRNDPCFCGKAKFKNCHLKSVLILKSVTIKQLKNDLKEFKNL